MGADQGMGRRAKKTAVEQDVHTGWRRLYCYTQRAGVCKGVKQVGNRRDRRDQRRALRGEA